MDRRGNSPGPERHREALRIIADALSEAGWKVDADSAPPPADLLVRRGPHRYAARLRAGAEPRRDRLIPLLAASILESRAAAGASSAKPLALVSAAHLSEDLIQELIDYAHRVAPDVAVGLLDADGRIEMRGPRLEALSCRPSRRPPVGSADSSHQRFDPFSDLNQWMLKVLLARGLPADLLKAPRAAAANGPELASVAQVSAPSAYRLIRHLNDRGFLDEVAPLRLVRVPELLSQWRAAYVRPPLEIRMRWLIPGKQDQLLHALRRYEASRHAHGSRQDMRRAARLPSACLALFSAADILGVGHVRGVPHSMNLERPDSAAFNAMGLVRAQANEPVHVVVRVPQWPRSVFRGAVDRDGIPVSDILQVWLDVSEHPARGAEQADHIWSRVLQRAFEAEDAR